MAARIAQITIDVSDTKTQAEFWSAALGLNPEFGEDGSAKLYPAENAPAEAVTVWLQPVSEPKRDKLRLHLDLRPEGGDVDGEVKRLLGLGATEADVGQTGDETFTVLADPEGNEFCVLYREQR
jgi:catechol 2,3-dioxygenase-like lactoylglutathione lyase family enzyme